MNAEARENWRLILTPAGEEWSGRARYAAAMYFFKTGEMSAEVLEIYRICSRLDDEDAVDALRAYRMGGEWIARVERMRAELDESESGATHANQEPAPKGEGA